MKHGTESFYIQGEGLVDTSLSGRSGHDPDRVDDPEAPPPSLADDEPPPFRFSRLGPEGRQLSQTNRLKIASAMIKAGKDPGDIPAGFTYLGQFVDHDLTSDRTKVELGEDVSPGELIQGRSPSLDLDSLYGAGPHDEDSERFYSDGVHLKVGRTLEAEPGAASISPESAPATTGRPGRRTSLTSATTRTSRSPRRTRRSSGSTTAWSTRWGARCRPICGSIGRAARLVKHYQWMLRTDFLPRIIDPSIVDDVFANGRRVVEPSANPIDVPTMPVEFSVAAFRIGHSMVRSKYNWNAVFDDGGGTLELAVRVLGHERPPRKQQAAAEHLGRGLATDVRLQ